uniref:Uncharacterized protein n=1 Tax=Arundo donax TaxID=35708 RepID=A0A0A9HFU2_ARUDO
MDRSNILLFSRNRSERKITVPTIIV